MSATKAVTGSSANQASLPVVLAHDEPLRSIAATLTPESVEEVAKAVHAWMTLGPAAADIRRENAELKIALLEACKLFDAWDAAGTDEFVAARARINELIKLAEKP